MSFATDTTLARRVRLLTARQLETWETARLHYAALSSVLVRELEVGGIRYRLQFNPARITSSAAQVDARSISRRKCFLCPENLPPEQERLPVLDHYNILINPYPIFPRHLTVPDIRHLPQRLAGRLDALLLLARALPDYTLFYNGPCCGASAPDHAHFQAGSKSFMPVEQDWRSYLGGRVGALGKAVLWWLADAPRNSLVIESAGAADAEALFDLLLAALPLREGDAEPMLNVLAGYDPPSGRWTIHVFPRRQHRPACYYAEGENRLLSSPASVDLGGVFILPRLADYERMSPDDLRQILAEVCLQEEESRSLRRQIANLLSVKQYEKNND